MKLFIFALASLLWTLPARGAPAPAGSSGDKTWVDDYATGAKRALHELDEQVTQARKDAARLSGEARAAADKHIAALEGQVARSQKDLDRLRRTGEIKAAKARKRLDSVIEDLRRQYEGLRKDLQEREPEEK